MDLLQTWDSNEEKCGWVKKAPVEVFHFVTGQRQRRLSCFSCGEKQKREKEKLSGEEIRMRKRSTSIVGLVFQGRVDGMFTV